MSLGFFNANYEAMLILADSGERSTVSHEGLRLDYEPQNHPKVLLEIRRFMVVCEVQYHPKGLRLDCEVQYHPKGLRLDCDVQRHPKVLISNKIMR